jgi:hypothetical protein
VSKDLKRLEEIHMLGKSSEKTMEKESGYSGRAYSEDGLPGPRCETSSEDGLETVTVLPKGFLHDGGIYLRRDGKRCVLRKDSYNISPDYPYQDDLNENFVYGELGGAVYTDRESVGDLVGIFDTENLEVKETKSEGGTKYDSGKPRMDLLVPEADELTARVLGFGSDKYGPYNWMNGIAYSRLHAALRRHLGSWAKGEDRDPESGLPHLAHARCCLDFLIWMSINREDLDDRPSPSLRNSKKEI